MTNRERRAAMDNIDLAFQKLNERIIAQEGRLNDLKSNGDDYCEAVRELTDQDRGSGTETDRGTDNGGGFVLVGGRMTVCPAFAPPWYRATMSTSSLKWSTIFPFPSSPHCAPTISDTGMILYRVCTKK